jgi:pyruvate-ferredoxin/flavodoxin oxidoreductase
LLKSRPEDAKRLWQQAQQDAEIRYRLYEYLAQRKPEHAAAPTDTRHDQSVPLGAGK